MRASSLRYWEPHTILCDCPAPVPAALLTLVLMAFGPAAGQAADVPGLESTQILSGDLKENWFSVFAPDGTTLATGGAGGMLKLWDVASESVRAASPASRDAFRCAAFAPDGKTLATGRASGTITVWDAQGARPLKSVRAHSAGIRSVSFSPDGRELITCGQDRVLHVWDTATWAVARSLPEQPQPILSAAIAPGGKLLAIALGDPAKEGRDGGVKLYDFATLAEQGELPGFSGVVWTIAFAPDGQTLAAGMGPSLWLWDPLTRRARATLKVPHTIRGVAFSPDGKTLVTVGPATNRSSERVEEVGQLCDVAPLQPRAILLSHRQNIVGVSFSPDGRLLSTATLNEPAVRLWDISKFPPPPEAAVAATPPTPNGNAAPSRLGQLPPGGLSLPGTPPLHFRSVIAGHASDVWCSVFAADGQTLATGGNDQIVRLWDPRTGAERSSLKATSALRCAVYFPGGERLAAGCANGAVQVWDVPQGKPVVTLKKNGDSIRTLAVAPDGKALAVGGNDKTLILYDTASWAEIHRLAPQREPILGLAHSPDGQTLAMATGHPPQGGAGGVKLLDATSLEERTVLPFRYDVWAVAFSPDGKLLATTSQAAPEPVQLWDLSTATALRALKPVGGARRIAFAPDGATLAVGQLSGTISLFDPATGRLLAAFRGHGGPIFGLGISPDGKLLATASGDGTVKLWDLPAATERGEGK